MAKLSDDFRRLYSWWWDSHISPKNSKWLRENLADMDSKIEAMIRLIEEDADSFAKRAEMFYKKRPELMKLLEQFYRAYRALAERYDYATGALRQAQRKMAEAFPNQIPLDFSDELPCESSATDAALSKFDLSDGPFEPDGLGKDLLDEICGHGEEVSIEKFAEGRTTKIMNFVEVRKCSHCKLLQKEIYRLSKENDALKNQSMLESVRADKAETEVECLKDTISKVKSEKEDALCQYKESIARVSDLENEISQAQAELKKLNDKMLMEVKCSNSAEEQNILLEKANQSLKLQLDILKQRIREQRKELIMKGEELEKLNILFQEEQQKSMKAEMACQNIKVQHTECEEEVRLLAMKIQVGLEKLKDAEQKNISLEQELQKIREEKGKLHQQKLSSALKTITLQEEILSLTHLKGKLKDEIGIHKEEKKFLQQELNHIKEDRNDLKHKYCKLTQELQAVNLNIDSLQTMVKDLRDGNLELTATIKKHEDEKAIHLQNLNHIGTMAEKNVVLETSLSDANDELDRLREKIKTLEDSCCYLHSRICIHQAEKVALVSHVEAASQNIEKLSRKNTFLENSLSDMNVELENLRGKLKGLEESCLSLDDQRSTLLTEKNTLMSQVNNISQSLKNLEVRYSELDAKHSDLEKEKDSALHRVVELQELLRQQKEEHSTLVHYKKSQLITLENQINLLQQEGRRREEELELEQHNIMNAQIEIFVLQKCLCDMKEGNLSLSIGSQKHKETLRTAEKIISELEQQCLIQEKKMKSLTVHNKKLREWIHLIVKLLKIDLEHVRLDDIQDELLMQLILHEIRRLLDTLSEAQDAKQHLLLEKSVVLTLLEQFGMYVIDLRSEKVAFEKEFKVKTEDFTMLRSKNDEILKMNEQLREDVQASSRREELLKAEVDIFFGQLSKLQEAHCTLQAKASKLFEENCCLSKKLHDLKERKDKLEEENNIILAEVMALDTLFVIFRTVNAERGLELQLISNERDYLLKRKDELEQVIRLINGRIVVLEAENKQVKESVANLEECKRSLLKVQEDLNTARSVCKQLKPQIDTGTNPLTVKDMGLSQVKQNLQNAQYNNGELGMKLGDLKLEVDEAKVVNNEMEKKISTLSDDIACKEKENACLHQENEVLKEELNRWQKDAEDLRSSGKNLTFMPEKGTEESTSFDEEITNPLNDIKFVTANAALFKEKLLELTNVCQSLEKSEMVQRKVLDEEILLRNLTINELKENIDVLEGENRSLRADLNAHLLLLGSLWDDVAVLEEHTFSLAKHHSTSQREDDQLEFLLHTKRSQEPTEGYTAAEPVGLSKLQDLHAKVKLLQKVVMDTGSHLELERLDSNASLESAWNEVEGVKSKESSDNETTKVSYDQIMKDIQLDIVLNSSRYENGRKTGNAIGITNQKLELWGTTEGGHSNLKQKAPLVSKENAIEQNAIEHYQYLEAENRCTMRELVAEKELGIDKPELCKKVKSLQEWRKSIRDKLSSDFQRLQVLQDSVQELQKTLEANEKIDCPTRFEFEMVKVQLNEAEETISKMIDINSKLEKKVQDFSVSLDKEDKQNKENSRGQKLISERARKLSEKIGRLEMELQKVQQNVLKFDEQTDKITKVVERRKGIVLREYIYGRRNSRKQKKASSCGCMRPRTNGD